jgi:hypothetical protein
VGIIIRVPEAEPSPRPKDPAQPPRCGSDTQHYTEEVRQFIDRKAQYEHPLRIRRASTWREAELYEQSRQWLQPSYNIGSRTYNWSECHFDRDSPDYIPTPVYNEIARAIQNEAARLGRPEYKPYVRPKGDNPTAKAKEAARSSAAILMDGLESNNWDTEVAEFGYRHMPLYGRWKIKSWWDVSWDETKRFPVHGALKCPAPGCDFTLAKADMDEREGMAADAFKPGRLERFATKEDDKEVTKYKASVCLSCDDHEEEEQQPVTDEFGLPSLDEMGAPVVENVTVRKPGPPALEPFTPVDEELDEVDAIGRELGEDKPVGYWRVKTCQPYDIFDEELGQTGGRDWLEILEVHVESLDWVRARFPHHGDKVKAENPETLLRYHPTCGERAVFASSVGEGEGLFRNHTRVKEYHKKPFMEYDSKRKKWSRNHGRSIMLCSGEGGATVLLLDGDFEMPSNRNPGQWIPRVHYDEAVFEFRSGGRERDGYSLFELLRDVQDNINQASSQRQDARERMGSPGWIATRGHNLSYEKTAGAGFQWIVDSPQDGSPAYPEQVGSTTISDGVNKEIESDLGFIQRNVMAETERGDVPPGVTAGNAIQLIAEQAGEHRRPRIRRIRKMLERVWSHGLLLCHEMVPDEELRSYNVKDEMDEWKQRTWTGADIAGQTDVKIEPEPEHNTSVVRRENIVTALNNRLIDPTQNRKMAIRIAKELEVPTEIFEDDDLQYDAAGREFWDFVDLNQYPVVDSSLDDDAAHSDQHGEDMLSPKWREIEAEAGWRANYLSVLYGWEEVYRGMVQAWGAFQESQNSPLPPAQPQIDPQTGQMIPPPPEPPPIQPPEVDLSNPDLQVQILAVWDYLFAKKSQQLQQEGQPPLDTQSPGVRKVMIFRAHKCAHDIRTEDKATAVQQGANVAAAPGTDAAGDGTMPGQQGVM